MYLTPKAIVLFQYMLQFSVSQKKRRIGAVVAERESDAFSCCYIVCVVT
jgi:hypothetical protein